MAQVIMNSMFTSKLNNVGFAQAILKLRRAFDDEISRLVDYRQNGIISADCFLKRTDEIVQKYDGIFIDSFDELEISEKIRLIATWKEFSDLAEQNLFEDSDILLSAARIIK